MSGISSALTSKCGASTSRESRRARSASKNPKGLRCPGNSASLPAMNDGEKVSLPPGKEPVLRMVPMPADANQHGDIFGGWIMAQVDVAGGVLAARHARGRVVTVAVNEFQFKQPVFIGDVLSFYGEIVRVGNTSITVNVEVYAQRNPSDVETVKVTEATLTYVAMGPDRRPRPVPPLPDRKR